MDDQNRDQGQLIDELDRLRRRVAELEAMEVEHKVIQEALHVSEIKYRNLFNNAQAGLFRTRISDGQVLDCNEMFARVTGFDSREECIAAGVSSQHYANPADRERIVNELNENGYVSNVEVEVTRRNGERFWVSYSAYIYPKSDCIEGALVDITERKRAEEALRRSEERFRGLVESASDVTVVLGSQGNVIYLSPNFETVWGFKAEGVLGQDMFKNIHPDDIPVIGKNFTQIIKNPKTLVRMQIRALYPDGTWHTLDSEARNHLDDPAIGGIVVNFHDVTELKQAQGELKKVNEWFEEIIGLSKTNIDVIDSEFNLRYVDPEWQKVYGDPAGRKCYEYFRGQKESCRDCAIPDTFRTHQTSVAEHVLPRENNRIVEVHTIPFQSADGEWLVSELNVDITERKRMEDALKEKERYFRSLIENSSDGIMVLDRDGKILYESPSCSRLLGYSEGERIGQVVFDPIHPDDMHVLIDGMKKIESDVEGRSEVRARHKDGSWHYFEVSAASFLDDPAVGGIVVNLRDITERKRAEEALHQGEEKYRILTERMNDIVWTMGLDFRPTYISPSVFKVLGFTPEERVGITNQEAVTPQSYEHIMSVFTAEMERDGKEGVDPDRTITIEAEYYHKNGGTVWLEHVVSANRDDQGKITGLYAVSRDITERKRAEEALRESDRLFKKLAYNVPGMIYQFLRRPDGTYCAPFSTDSIKDILGCSPEDVRDDFSPVTRVVLPEDLGRLVESIEYSAEHMTPWQCEYRVQVPGKPVRWLLGQSTPEKLADGSVIWHGFNTDITDRKRMEYALRESEEKYSTLVESATDGVSIIQDQALKFVNKRMSEMSGYTVEELTGMSTFDLVTPDFTPVLEERFRLRAEGKEVPEIFETRMLCKDGTIKEMESSTKLIQYEDRPAVIAITRDVTERRRMEEALRESEEKYSTLVENAIECVTINRDEDKRILYANKRMSEVSGYSIEELLGMTIIDLIPPDFFPVLRQRFQMRMEGQEIPDIMETRLLCKDGTIKELETSTRLIEYRGSPAVMSITRDFTERRRMEELLRESEERYRMFAENASDALWITDMEFNLTYHSGGEHIFGYTAEEMLKRSVDQRMTPESIQTAFGILQEELAIEQLPDKDLNRKRVVELAQYHRNGSIIHTEEIVAFLRDDNGKAISITGVSRDITERKRAEEALRESEEKYRLLAENASDVIMLMDMNARAVYFSPSVTRLLGYSVEEALAGNMDDRMTPASMEKAVKHFMAGLHRERRKPGASAGQTLELDMIHKNGSIVVVEMIVSFIRGESGKPTGMMAILRDITERKRAEKELKFKEMLLDVASDSMIVHDLRGNIIYANDVAHTMRGYESGEIIGKDIRDLVSPDYAGLLKGRIEEVMQKGATTFECEHLRKDKTTFPVEVHASVIDVDGTKLVIRMGRDITERKKAEARIIELSNAFMATLDPVLILDMEGNVRNVNEATRKLFETEELGVSALKYVDPEDRERIGAILQGLIANGQPAVARYNIVTRSGRRVPLEASGNLMLDADGRPVGIVVVARDLTECVQAESRQKLAADILGILNEPIALPDAINRILSAIKQQTGFYAVGIRLREGDDYPYFVQNGFSEDFLLTENTLVVRDRHGDVCRDKDGRVSLECTCGLVLSGKTDPSNPLFTPGGSAWTNDSPALLDVPLEQDPRLHPRNRCIHAGFQSVALMPIRSGNEIVGLLQLNDRRKGCFTPEMIRFFEGIAASIGVALMRKRAEEALRSSEEKMRSLSENSPDVIMIIDREGRILFINRTVPEMTIEEVLGQCCYDYISQEYRQAYVDIVERVFRTGINDRAETRGLGQGGEISWYETRFVPLQLAGEGQTVMLIARDITERKRAEEALRASEIKYRQLFEHTLLGMEVIDAETGKIVLANHSMARMFEFKSPEEMVGIDAIKEHVMPEDMDWVLDQFAQSMADPERKEVSTIRARTVNGRLVWVTGSATSFEYEGRPAALLSLIDVTAAKEAEEALLRISKAVEGSSDAIGMSDPQGHHFYHNQAFTELFEYTPEELHAAGDGQAAFANKHVARKVFDTIMGGGSWSGEVEMVSKSGRRFIVLERADAIKDDSGKVIGLVGVHTDITERKKAEEKLRETRDYMENLIEHANVPMVVWAPDFRITRFNRAFERLTGMKARSVIGKDLEILFPKGTRERSMSFIRTAMRGARWEVVEIPIANLDGDVRTVLWNISPIYAEDGKTPMAIIAQGQDITERKQAEEALRESEELSRSMLESAAMGIYLLQNKRFIYVNPMFEEIIGYSSEELLGQEAIDFVHPDDRDTVRTKAVENIQGASAQPYEFRALRKDGRQIWVMERVTPVRYKGRRAVLASFMETTEHKKAEVELERAYEDLKTMHENMVQSQKLRAMGEMASGIAHDFNNMLAVILGRTQLVIDDVKDDKVKKGIQVIEQAALDAAKTVKRLQDFARIRVEHPFEPLDVNEVAEGVLKMVESRRVELEQTKGIAIKAEQELGKVGKVSGDAAELREALLNILFNALDAMPTGGKLTVKTLQDEEWVQITIKDTGVGIPDKVKAKVFEPFFTTKSSKGSGLGLSVTYGIIARHGGMIKFDSEVGKGTTFHIRLPLAVEEVRKQARKSKAVAAKPASILTVDDEPEVLRALGLTLEYFGHWVKDFTSGAEAIKAFKDGKYDVVITDLGMPEVSGWDVARAIKKMKPEVPVLLISGWVIDLDEEQKKLVDGVIAKPFSRESIAAAVSKVFPAKKKGTANKKQAVKKSAVKKSGGKKKSTRTKKSG